MAPGAARLIAVGAAALLAAPAAALNVTVTPLTSSSALWENNTEVILEYNVTLAAEPTADVVVTATYNADETWIEWPDATAFLNASVFGPSNWSDVQVVALHPVDNAWCDQDVTFQVVFNTSSADPGFDGAEQPAFTLVNYDDDWPWVDAAHPGTYLILENSTAAITYEMRLSSGVPLADVTVDIVSNDTTAGDLDGAASFTFTAATWNQVHTVSATTVDDDLLDGGQPFRLVHTVSSGDPLFDSLTVGIHYVDATLFEFTAVDNEEAFVVQNTTSPCNETDAQCPYTVRLGKEPITDVTLDVTLEALPAWGYTLQATGTSSQSLVFETTNWNTDQTVMLLFADDDVQYDDRYANLTHAVRTLNPGYPGYVPPNVTLHVIENDEADVVLGQLVGDTQENIAALPPGQGLSTFALSVATEPQFDVVLHFFVETPSTCRLEGGPTSVDVEAVPLTFAPSTWTAPQTVTIYAIDNAVDDVDDGLPCRLHFNVSSDDPFYFNMSLPAYGVTTIDDDVAGVTLTYLSGQASDLQIEAAVVSVELDTEPVAAVTVQLDTTDATKCIVVPGTETLVYNATNWNETQNTSIWGVPNQAFDFGQACTLRSFTASRDPNYDPCPNATLMLTTRNDESPQMNIKESNGTAPFNASAPGATRRISENGTLYWVVEVQLETMPGSNIHVSAAIKVGGVDDATEAAVVWPENTHADAQPNHILFTQSDYTEWQTLTILPLDDYKDDGDVVVTVTLLLYADFDLNYDGLAYDFPIVNIDDDTLEFKVDHISGNTSELGGDNTSDVTIGVQLGTYPDGAVTVDVTSSDTGEGIVVGGAQLVFAPQDWNVTQNITIRGINDQFVDGDIPYDVVLDCTSSGVEYAGYQGRIGVVNEDRFDVERATSRNFTVDVLELATGWGCPSGFAFNYSEAIESLDACRIWCEENDGCVAYTYQDHWAGFTRLARCRLFTACPLADREWLNVYDVYVGSWMHRISPVVVWHNGTDGQEYGGDAADAVVVGDYRGHFTAFNAPHEWTVALQVRPKEFHPNGVETVFSTVDASGVRGFRLLIADRRWMVQIGDGAELALMWGPHVVYHTFTHIHLTFTPGVHEDGIVLMYINGVLEAHRWAGFAAASEAFTTGGSTAGEATAGVAQAPFSGAIRELTAWDRFLDLTLFRAQTEAAAAVDAGKTCPPGPGIDLQGAPSWFVNNHSRSGVQFDGRCIYLFPGDQTCHEHCRAVNSACDGDGLDALTTAPTFCEAAMQRLGVGYTHVHHGRPIGHDPTGLFPVDRAAGGCAATPHGELLFASPHGSCHARLNVTLQANALAPHGGVDFAQLCVCDDSAPPPPPTKACDTGDCERCPVVAFDDPPHLWQILHEDAACGSNASGAVLAEHAGASLVDCRQLCEGDAACVSIDHYSWEERCVLLSAACTHPADVGNGTSSHARTPIPTNATTCAGNGTAVTTLPAGNDTVCECQRFCAGQADAMAYASLDNATCTCFAACAGSELVAGKGVDEVTTFAVPLAEPRDVCEPHGMQRVNQGHPEDRSDLGAMDLGREGGFAFSGWYRVDGGVVPGAARVTLGASTRWRITAMDALPQGWGMCDLEFFADDACTVAYPDLMPIDELDPTPEPPPYVTPTATETATITNTINQTDPPTPIPPPTPSPNPNMTYYTASRYPPQQQGDYDITQSLADNDWSTCQYLQCGDNGGAGCGAHIPSFVLTFSRPVDLRCMIVRQPGDRRSLYVQVERGVRERWEPAWECTPEFNLPRHCMAPAGAAAAYRPALPETRPLEVFSCAAQDGDEVSLVVENSTVRYSVSRSPRANWLRGNTTTEEVVQWDLPFAPLPKDAAFHQLGVVHKSDGHVSLLVDMVEMEDAPFSVEPPSPEHPVRLLDGLMTVRFGSDNFNWSVTPEDGRPAAVDISTLPQDPYPWKVYQKWWPPPGSGMVEFVRWGINGTKGTAEPLRNGSFPFWEENATPRGKWGAARFGADDGDPETHTGLRFTRPIAEQKVNATQYFEDQNITLPSGSLTDTVTGNATASGNATDNATATATATDESYFLDFLPPQGTTIFAVIKPNGGAPNAHLLDASGWYGITANQDKVSCWVGGNTSTPGGNATHRTNRTEVAAFAPFTHALDGWLLVECRIDVSEALMIELRVNAVPFPPKPVPGYIAEKGSLVDVMYDQVRDDPLSRNPQTCRDIQIHGRQWQSGYGGLKIDGKEWYNEYGEPYTCGYFEAGDPRDNPTVEETAAFRCAKSGHLKPLHGYDANTACCICGGGVRGVRGGPDTFGYTSRRHESQWSDDPDTWDPQDNATAPRSGEYYEGWVAELRVYGVALLDEQMTLIERWLASKYFGGQFMAPPPPGLRGRCHVGGGGGNVSGRFNGTVRDVLVFAEDVAHEEYAAIVADGTVPVQGTVFARGFGCTAPHHCEERNATSEGGDVALEHLQLDWIGNVGSHSTVFEGTVLLDALPKGDNAPLFTFGGRGCGVGGISAWAFLTDNGRYDLAFGAMRMMWADRPAAVLTQAKLQPGVQYDVRFEMDLTMGGGTQITYSAEATRYPPPIMADFFNASGVWDTFDNLCLGEAPCVGTHPEDGRYGQLNSPEVILTTSSEIDVDTYGAAGENVSITGRATANRTGFVGVGLYDVRGKRYIMWRARAGYLPTTNASGVEVSGLEVLKFRAHELRGYAGRRVRIDLIDDYCTPFYPSNNTKPYVHAGTYLFPEVPSACNTGRGWTGFGKVILRQVNSTRAAARVVIDGEVAGFQRLYLPHPIEVGDVSLLTRCHQDPSAGGLNGTVDLTLGCPKSTHLPAAVWCKHHFGGADEDYAAGGAGALGALSFGHAFSAAFWVQLDRLQSGGNGTALFDFAASHPVGAAGPTDTNRVALEWRDGELHYRVRNLRPQRRNEDEEPHGTETQHEIVGMDMPSPKSDDDAIAPVNMRVPRTPGSNETVLETLEYVGCFATPVLLNQSAAAGASAKSLQMNTEAARAGGWEYIAMANHNGTFNETGLGGSLLFNGLYGAADLTTEDCRHDYLPCEEPAMDGLCGCAGVSCEGYALNSGRCNGSIDVTNTPPEEIAKFLRCMQTLQSWAVWRRVYTKFAVPVDSRWHHVALVHHNDLDDASPASFHDGMKLGTAVLSVDGVVVRSERMILPNMAVRDKSFVGRSNGNGHDLHGWVREMYLWDGAVPAADLHAVSRRTMQPFLPEARLVVAASQDCKAPPLGYGQCLTGDTTNIRDPRLCDRPVCECNYNGFWCAVSAWRWGDTTEYWEGAWAADPGVFDGVKTPRLEKARCYTSSDTPERCKCEGDVVMHAYNPLKTKVKNLNCVKIMNAFDGRMATKLPMEFLVPTEAGMVLCPNIHRRTVNDFAPNTIHERGIRY
eukprot:TRINITY_DN7920_c0_g3_i2.p1 TRINITY_DN7920_c0_g3~~TRINITY_DN7920_c0_g3_i2.p1  ORF type:complete len:3358 (+),score=1056.22 TRINITY_DN7920_c0_g3_i2:68-10141(+)